MDKFLAADNLHILYTALCRSPRFQNHPSRDAWFAEEVGHIYQSNRYNRDLSLHDVNVFAMRQMLQNLQQLERARSAAQDDRDFPKTTAGAASVQQPQVAQPHMEVRLPEADRPADHYATVAASGPIENMEELVREKQERRRVMLDAIYQSSDRHIRWADFPTSRVAQNDHEGSTTIFPGEQQQQSRTFPFAALPSHPELETLLTTLIEEIRSLRREIRDQNNHNVEK